MRRSSHNSAECKNKIKILPQSVHCVKMIDLFSFMSAVVHGTLMGKSIYHLFNPHLNSVGISYIIRAVLNFPTPIYISSSARSTISCNYRCSRCILIDIKGYSFMCNTYY